MPRDNSAWQALLPPPQHVLQPGHHWVKVRGYTREDNAGYDTELMVLMWNPETQRWCESGDFSTGQALSSTHYEYIAPCPPPLSEKERQTLRQTCNGLDSEADRVRAEKTPMLVGTACWDWLRTVIKPMLDR